MLILKKIKNIVLLLDVIYKWNNIYIIIFKLKIFFKKFKRPSSDTQLFNQIFYLKKRNNNNK